MCVRNLTFPSCHISCKVIHDERKTLMQSDAEYLRGFALFMSELFVHMNQKDASTRFRVLGRAVRELLLTFLEHPTPGNVKCVCQILKVRIHEPSFVISTKLVNQQKSV